MLFSCSAFLLNLLISSNSFFKVNSLELSVFKMVICHLLLTFQFGWSFSFLLFFLFLFSFSFWFNCPGKSQ